MGFDILGCSSDHINFLADGKEYVVVVHEVRDGEHWSEYLHKDETELMSLRNRVERQRLELDRLHRTVESQKKTIKELEAKHGRWILINESLAKCSVCGALEATNGIDKTGKGLIFKAVKRYCSNCGARMQEQDS